MGLRHNWKESIRLEVQLRAVIGNLQYAFKEMLKDLRATLLTGRHRNK